MNIINIIVLILIILFCFSLLVIYLYKKKLLNWKKTAAILIGGSIITGGIILFSPPGDETDYKFPTSYGEDYTDWTDPENALTENDVYASAVGENQFEDYYNFNFNVPSGATIDGILVEIEAYADDEQSLNIELSWDGGDHYTESMFECGWNSGMEIYQEYGSSTNLWGHDWIDTEFSNSNFRLRAVTMIKGYDINIDFMKAKIFYSTTSFPEVYINFVGNLSDSGGPYWNPTNGTGEETVLSGVWSDGYYTNNSYQHEKWIYINATVNDSSDIEHVWINWLNGTTWVNWTYTMQNIASTDYWIWNSTGYITNICSGYKYSFDVVANNTGALSTTLSWTKKGYDNNTVRRYVSLNNTPVNLSYSNPFYIYNWSNISATDVNKYDSLLHDQGTDGTTHDTGMLRIAIPDNDMEYIWCTAIINSWFDENICYESGNITNVYYHLWGTSYVDDDNNSNATLDVCFNHTREYWDGSYMDTGNQWTTSYDDAVSYMQYNITGIPPEFTFNHNYSLSCHLLDVDDWSFTDNNIYEMIPLLAEPTGPMVFPSYICNRSVMSWVEFNVPDNVTLQSLDTDYDNLNDYIEHYVSFTNSYIADTDNDGINDYWEYHAASDPNNYLECFNVTFYNDTIRNYGIDYFVWLGENMTLDTISGYIDGFDETEEYVAVWNNDIWLDDRGCWNRWIGSGDGYDGIVHTFDVIKTNLNDSIGNQTISMPGNPYINYTNTKAIILVNTSINKGYNFSCYNRMSNTTLSTINTTDIGLSSGDMVAVWNRSWFGWDVWISGFGITDKTVSQWDIVETKVSGTKTWNT